MRTVRKSTDTGHQQLEASPRTRPIASKPTFRRLVKQYADLMGFARPFKVYVVFHDARKEDFCDPKDVDCYACCEVQPQYHRATLHFDQYHPAWDGRNEEVEECVRHELGHAFVGMYTQAATHIAGDNTALKDVLADLEDDLVQRISAMPIWAYAE